jgi:RNA polymerase sigma-70 factor (ECF subfamily)
MLMAAPETHCAGMPAASTTEQELLDRVRAGEREAFEALYELYFARIYRYVDKRLSNRADTEETVQEVFFNVFSSIDSFRGEAPFAAWVFGLARRTIASRFKKRRHPTVPLLEDDDPQAIDLWATTLRREADPLEAYEASERLARMAEVVENDLSEEQWLLFQLHHLQNHSIHEIARATKKSEDAIKSNLYRARKALLAR